MVIAIYGSANFGISASCSTIRPRASEETAELELEQGYPEEEGGVGPNHAVEGYYVVAVGLDKAW
jgi:hypothetical protein